MTAPSFNSWGDEVLLIDAALRFHGGVTWSWDELLVRPGTTVQVGIEVQNDLGLTAEDVVVGVNLDDGLMIDSESIVLVNSNHPSGVSTTSDQLWNGGLNLGNYASGANLWILADLTAPILPGCDVEELWIQAVVKPGTGAGDAERIWTGTVKLIVEPSAIECASE